MFKRFSFSMWGKRLQALHEGGKRSSWIAAQMLTSLAPATGTNVSLMFGTHPSNYMILVVAIHQYHLYTELLLWFVLGIPWNVVNVVWWVTFHKGKQEIGTQWHASKTVSNLEMLDLLGKETDCKQQQHPLVKMYRRPKFPMQHVTTCYVRFKGL